MPIVCHNDLSAVSSSSKGKQVFNIKSKTFWTFLPDFALVLKNSFSLKLPVGLPFISFCSKDNILLAEDAISWELLVIRLFWCLLPSQDSLVRMRSAVVDSAPLALKRFTLWDVIDLETLVRCRSTVWQGLTKSQQRLIEGLIVIILFFLSKEAEFSDESLQSHVACTVKRLHNTMVPCHSWDKWRWTTPSGWKKACKIKLKNARSRL